MRVLRIGAIQLAIIVFLMELGLRLYNPLPFRVRGDRIMLPVNATYDYENSGPKLDRHVHHTKNSLGFRGPEPPRNLAARLSIITVGGSTTECMFLSDGKTWPDHVAARLTARFPNVWLNNAGLDGQSTYGHLALLDQVIVPLRPNVVAFLIGMNDLALVRENRYDRKLEPNRSMWRRATAFATDHSELLAIAQNVKRAWSAHIAGLGHTEISIKDWPHFVQDEATWASKMREYAPALPLYEERLTALIERSRQHGIDPVFITQPALFGNAIDPSTGVDLSTIRVYERNSGGLEWQLLEQMNDVARRIAQRRGVLLIDLARELPKDSRFYYDLMHYSNEGAARVGEIVAGHLEPYLAQRFSDRLRLPE